MAKTSKTDPAKKYEAHLDTTLGRLADRDGRRVYGHRRLQAQRKIFTTEQLRSHFAPALVPAPESGSVLTSEERELLLSEWVKSVRGDEVDYIAPELPSAASASRSARAACLAVAIIGALVVVGMEVDIAAAIAATPLGKLLAGAFGRIV